MRILGGGTEADTPSATRPAVKATYASLAALILLATPPLLALLTWQEVYRSNYFRYFSVPAVVGELLLVILAVLSGLGTTRPSRASIAAGLGLIGVATYTANAVAQDGTLARYLLLITLNHLLFAATLWIKLDGDWRPVRRILLAAVAGGIAIMVIISYILALSVRDIPDFRWGRFGAGVSDVRHLGYYGTALTGLAAGLYATGRGRRSTIATLVLLTIGFTWTNLGGGRAAFVAGLLACALVLIFVERRRRMRGALGMTGAFLLAIPLSLAWTPAKMWGLPLMFAKFFGNAGIDDFSSRRVELWRETISAIAQRPIFGHGEGQFRQGIAASLGRLNHPHDALLQYLYQWGIVGTLCLAVLTVPTILRAPAAARAEPGVAIPAIAAAGGVLALALLDGPLFYALPAMIVILCLAMIRSVEQRIN